MSRKSRQPDDGADTKEKKNKKGKKGAEGEAPRAQLVVETKQEGVPFAIVVLLAAVMSAPTVLNHLAGELPFDQMMLRIFAALAVAWLLSALVYAVIEAVRPPEVQAVVELPPEAAYDVLAGHPPAALSGTIVGDEPQVDDPFALDPVPEIAPVEVPPVEVPPLSAEPQGQQPAA